MKKTFTFIIMLCIIGMANLTNAQEVKLNNNLVVEGDGTLRMDNDATVWNDIYVSADATTKGDGVRGPIWGGANPTAFRKDAAGTSQGVYLWMFSPSQEQEVYFTIQLPHSYKTGSAIYPRVHWTTATGTPTKTNVVWALEYTIVPFGALFPVTSTITGNNEIASFITPSGTRQHLCTPLGTISGSSPSLGFNTVIVCRLYRAINNGSDTFGNETGLLGFDLLYESDTQGSRYEYIK